MKTILIVDDRQSPWEDVALMLEGVNAEIHIHTLKEALGILERNPPEIAILGEESRHAVTACGGSVTKIVISDEIPSGEIIRSREGRSVIRIGWPVHRDTFLELTRRALAVPERRPFRAPIAIARKSDKRPLQGNSEDFSLTGMAFRTTAVLARDDEIAVSIDDAERQGLRLKARVVRSAPGPSGEGTLYGARFLSLSPALRHALERFVWRIRRHAS